MKLVMSQYRRKRDNGVEDESMKTEELQCTLGLVNVNGRVTMKLGLVNVNVRVTMK